jgi:hypothetical protein
MNNKKNSLFMISVRILITIIIIGLLILFVSWIIGLKTSIEYSNAFFIVGGVLIALGTLSIMGGFKIRGSFFLNFSQSAGALSLQERTQQNVTDSENINENSVVFTIIGVIYIVIAISIDKLL